MRRTRRDSGATAYRASLQAAVLSLPLSLTEEMNEPAQRKDLTAISCGNSIWLHGPTCRWSWLRITECIALMATTECGSVWIHSQVPALLRSEEHTSELQSLR